MQANIKLIESIPSYAGANRRGFERSALNQKVCCSVKSVNGSIIVSIGQLVDASSKAVKISLPFNPPADCQIAISPKLDDPEPLRMEMPLTIFRTKSTVASNQLYEVVCSSSDKSVNVVNKIKSWNTAIK